MDEADRKPRSDIPFPQQHQNGQSRRIDTNGAGHPVIQLQADYQDRRRTLDIATGKREAESMLGVGIGDGWLRLMRFDPAGSRLALTIRTYSTYYAAIAGQLPTYSAAYKSAKKPAIDDAAFLAQEDFTIPLDTFRPRFGPPK